MNSYLKDPVLACTVSLLLLMTTVMVVLDVADFLACTVSLLLLMTTVMVVLGVADFLDALRDAEHPRPVWSAIEAPRTGVDCWQHDDTREVVCVDATGCDS